MKWNPMLSFALCASTSMATAAEWRQPLPVEGGTPLSVDHVLAHRDGYLLVSAASATWVRVDAGGVAQVDRAGGAVPVPARAERQLFAIDGERVLFRPAGLADPNACVPQLLDGGGRVQVAATEGSCRPLQEDPPALDGDGSLWLASVDATRWLRMQRDGRVREVPLPADASSSEGAFSPQPDAAAAYIVYQAGNARKLARLTPQGVAWSLDAPMPDIHLRSAHALANGDALLVGQQGSRTAHDRLWLARVSPGGQLRWQRVQPDAIAGSQAHVRVLGGDRVAIAVRPDASGAAAVPVHLFDGDGHLQRTLIDDEGEFVRFVPGPGGDPRALPRGFGYFLGRRTTGVTGPVATAVVHVDGDGVVAGRYTLSETATAESASAVNRAALLSDGSLVYVAGQGGQHLRHAVAGGGTRATPDLATLQPRPRTLLRGTTGDTGDAYTLARVGDGPLQLRAFDRDGGVRWTATLPAGTAQTDARPDDGLLDRQGRIVFDGDRVCVGPTFRRMDRSFDMLMTTSVANCYARDDGRELASLDQLPVVPQIDAGQLLPDIHARGGDRLVVVEYGQRPGPTEPVFTLNRVTIDRGAVTRDRLADPGIGYPQRPGGKDSQGANVVAAFTDLGTVSALAASSDGYALVTTVGGRSQSLRFPGVDLGELLRMERTAEGRFVVHTRSGGQHQVRLLNADGSVRWQREYAVTAAPATHPVLLFASGSGRVVVLLQQRIAGRQQRVLEIIDQATGNRLVRDVRNQQDGRGVHALALDTARRMLALLQDGPSEPVLVLLSSSDGQVLGQRALGCGPAPGCAPSMLALDPDGSVRTFGGDVEAARYELASTLAPPPTAQRGLAGTWYAPGTTGQGLLVDVAPETGIVSAAWFTYSLAGDPGVSGLRWMSLLGEGAGSGAVELTVYGNRGGRFASPPRTEARTVGIARLQLRGCNDAVLSYRLRSGEFEGLDGEVPLQRLTAPAFDCTEADGRVLSAPSGLRGGIGARHSGAWYEPATSGQGLLFDVRSPSGQDPGHLVAGWFTYDPAGASDDDASQHWFLLDASLADAQDGAVTAQVYRAVGGRFDLQPTVNTQRVGEARVRFAGCGTATLDYRFDDTEIAAEFAGRQGRINLERLLPCQP